MLLSSSNTFAFPDHVIDIGVQRSDQHSLLLNSAWQIHLGVGFEQKIFSVST